MICNEAPDWKKLTVPPEEVLAKISPAPSIFLSTGMAEPRTLVKHLMASTKSNLQDLGVIQLISLGDTIPIDERYSRKYRLKTFFSGWVVSDAVSQGRVDLIPSRFSRIPWLIESEGSGSTPLLSTTPPMQRATAASASEWTWPGMPWKRPHSLWERSMSKSPEPWGYTGAYQRLQCPRPVIGTTDLSWPRRRPTCTTGWLQMSPPSWKMA